MRVFIVCLLCLFSSSYAQDFVRIEVGKEGNSSTRDLNRRVRELERAVTQLQDRIFQLERELLHKHHQDKAELWTCYLNDPMVGSFTATEATQSAAIARVLRRCEEKNPKSIFCNDKKITCGK